MTTIQKIVLKIKQIELRVKGLLENVLRGLHSEEGKAIAISVIIIAASVASFLLGTLSASKNSSVVLDISHRQPYYISTDTNNSAQVQQEKGKIVASRKGKKYHYVWCPGANTIAEKNKRYFADEAAARRAGLEPAGNCPGLK